MQNIISLFKSKGIRTSIFVDPDPELVIAAKSTGTDRIELYTESYAKHFLSNKKTAIFLNNIIQGMLLSRI